MNKPELLAPAGNYYRGTIAIDFGADAIYFGGQKYSLRARSSNFSTSEIKKMIDYVHQQNKKAYLVTNILCHHHDFQKFKDFLREIKNCLPDAFICSDPAIIQILKKTIPNVEIHISTQQSVTNSKAALFFSSNKASRVILAREVSLNDVNTIINKTKNKIDIEMFVHGALCVAYSGRCMLSNYMSLRDSNNGGCAHSCR
jgi:putative protease